MVEYTMFSKFWKRKREHDAPPRPEAPPPPPGENDTVVQVDECFEVYAPESGDSVLDALEDIEMDLDDVDSDS